MAYRGKIKSFNDQKGWGFIECAETFEIYGKDIFLPKRVLPNGGAQPGAQVTFNVEQDATGIFAKDIRQISNGKSNAYNGKGSMPMGKGMTSGKGSGKGYWNGGGDYFVGVIKSFNATKGYGMISCDRTFQMYGKDVFVSSAVMAMLPPYVGQGSQVSFSIMMEEKGPVAKEMWPMESWPAERWAPYPMYPPMPTWSAWSPYQAPPMPPQPKLPDSRKVYYGTIKNYSDEKQWGHISCETTKALYGKDIFLMSGKLNGQSVEAGSQVMFSVIMSGKGPQANEVKILPPGSIMLDGEPGNLFEGTVKSFNQEKGWGFLEGEQVTEVFGKDIFLHKRELDGANPSVGDFFTFAVEIDKLGQPVAKNVVPAESAFQPAKEAAPSKRAAPY